MLKAISKAISFVFSPLLIPTYAALILLYSGFHFSMFSWEAKRFLLIVVVISTAIMPAITLTIAGLGKKLQVTAHQRGDLWIPMIFSALYYYLGFYLLNKMPFYAIFKVLLLSGAILIVILMMISLKWKISYHTAAAGSLFGLLTALSLRLGANPLMLLSIIAMTSGIIGTARIILRKNNLGETLAGFPIGFLVFFLIFFLL
ncbi:hypothetical protein BA6E_121174 [Bacteroidales bacterium 6E]|nr:hypothetical protein BA6E_121174 [Bacteroidales bacterium 6E]